MCAMRVCVEPAKQTTGKVAPEVVNKFHSACSHSQAKCERESKSRGSRRARSLASGRASLLPVGLEPGGSRLWGRNGSYVSRYCNMIGHRRPRAKSGPIQIGAQLVECEWRTTETIDNSIVSRDFGCHLGPKKRNSIETNPSHRLDWIGLYWIRFVQSEQVFRIFPLSIHDPRLRDLANDESMNCMSSSGLEERVGPT